MENKKLKFFKRRFPISKWIQNYSKEDLLPDLIAGITISLTMIPQSIAYASLAGLDPQYGLNSAFIGCFIYVFFGTVKEVVIGPSSLMAILTYEYTHNLNIDFVILLSFLCGIVELIMGTFHLGFLVGVISKPVVSGFTTATSIIVIIAQIKGLLGLNFKSKGSLDNLIKLYDHINDLKLGDLILGFSSIICLLLLRQLKDIKLKTIPGASLIKKLCWFISIGRNFLIVFITSCITMIYSQPPFITTKSVESGIPSWKFPPIKTQMGNQTYNFNEMITELGAGYLVIPTVSVLANVAIAKAFATGSIDATQEMLSLSLCNIFGSFFQSMPTCGAFTRSAVISSSGVRTPLAGIYSALLTLTALKFLGPYFHYIPRASLSAVLIAAVLFLIDIEIFKPLWKNNKLDFLCLNITLFASLAFGVEVGIIFGVTIGITELIFKWLKPSLKIETNKTLLGTYVSLWPETDLYFPSVDFFSSQVLKCLEKHSMPIVINCRNIKETDYSVAKSIAMLNVTIQKQTGHPLMLIDVSSKCKNLWIAAGCKEEQFCSFQDLNQVLFGDDTSSLPLLNDVQIKMQDMKETKLPV